MRVVLLVFVAVLVIAPFSEGGKRKRWWNKGESESSSEDEYGDKSFEFQTYNAALDMPTVGGLTRATRLERLLDAIRSSTADVLLLQEVGSEFSILKIIDAVRDYFPHSLSFLGVDPTPGSGESVDTCENLSEYVTCIRSQNCASDNRTAADRFYCPWRYCNMVVENMPPLSIECVECAIKPCYSMERVQNMTALQECFDEARADGYCNVDHTNRPPRDTSSGTISLHGLLLLSKREIRKFWLHDIIYPSGVQTLSDRGFLIARIRGIGNVVGTKLSKDAPQFTDYSSGMTMWNTVNNWEMYHVFEKVCEDLGDKRKVVVLGGTNNGPAVTNVCPEVREKFPRNFRIAGNNGFRSVLLGSVNRQCTKCETNPLTMTDDVNINTISDHIFVKEDSYLETVEAKVLVNTLNSQSGPGSEPFSPYYGVAARITGFGKKQKSSELFSWSVDEDDLFPSSWKWTGK